MIKFRTEKSIFVIRRKIIAVIYLVLFPVLIVASGLFFHNHYNVTRNEAIRQYNSIIQSIGSSVEFVESNILNLALYFSVNADINRLLSDFCASAMEDPLFWINQAHMVTVREFATLTRHIQTLIIYPENGLPPFFVSKDASVHNTNIKHIRTLPIYERSAQARGDIVVERINVDSSCLFLVNRTDKIAFARTLFDVSKNYRLGFLVITVGTSWYERILYSARLHDSEVILILNSDRNEVARIGEIDDAVLAFVQSREYTSDEGRLPHYNGWYIMRSEYTRAGKVIYYLSPQDYWIAWIRNGIMPPIMLAFVLLVCILPLSIFASKFISRPMDQIIDRNYVMALREREIELNTLQAQINPHFLYNALDSLYWKALDNEQENLAEDILSMSDLFRLLLSSGDSEITVERELKIITNYLQIQKMRFSRKIDYSINIDDKMLNFMIPKLMLQPFVENAVVHGLEEKETHGFIRIEGFIDGDMMVFTIEDSGAGMTPDILEEILSNEMQKRHITSYAIRNVRERMLLKYNSRCKLEITSELGMGSKVKISVPMESTRGV